MYREQGVRRRLAVWWNRGWLLFVLLVVPALRGAEYVWNGAGVSGGTGDTNWDRADNWLVGGSVPALAPGAQDDVAIAFDAVHEVPALTVPHGAVARHVTLDGTSTSSDHNRFLDFAGDATFATLDYLGAVNTYAWRIPEGFTLTLDGGDIDRPTLKHHEKTSAVQYTTIKGDGLVTVTADPAYIELGQPLPSDHINQYSSMIGVQLRFATLGAIDFDWRLLGVKRGSIEFVGSPVIVNPPPYLRLDDGAEFLGSSDVPLDLSATVFWPLDRSDHGSLGNVCVKAFVLSSHTSSSGDQEIDASGDWIVSGEAVHDPGSSYSHTVTGAVYISRLERILTRNHSRLRMLGYDLSVTSGASVIVGDVVTPGNDFGTDRPRSMLNLRQEDDRASTLTVAGDLWVGFNGNIAGDATSILKIGGDFRLRLMSDFNTSVGSYTGFDLAQSRVEMAGANDVRNPRLLEVHGVDFGATMEGQVANNQAFGTLVVGTPTQAGHVRLIDLDDYEGDEDPDALYLGELTIYPGSTLDIRGGIPLYVNGVRVDQRATGFGGGKVIDSTIPSGTLISIR